ncbi:MAG: hypothetical protein ACFB50_10565 [Rubrobacteraceae bacterium]
MGRRRASGTTGERIMMGSTVLGGIIVLGFIVLGALGGNPIFAAILSGMVGVLAGIGLARLAAIPARNGWIGLGLVVPAYIAFLVAVLAFALLFSPGWLTGDSSESAFGLPAPLAALTGFVGGASEFFWHLIRDRFRRSDGHL